MLEKAISLLTLTGFVYGFFKFIKPRMKMSKLKRFGELVVGWFDFIDKSNIDDVNVFELNNLENKISSYIEDHGIGDDFMKFDERFRRKFVKFCTLSADSYSDAEYERFSRLPAKGLTVREFWLSIMGEFMKFRKGYKEGSPDVNYADVEMRVKALKMYFGLKVE